MLKVFNFTTFTLTQNQVCRAGVDRLDFLKARDAKDPSRKRVR